jgi:glycosyltransferase involved in cell wall biosynthesis
MNNKKKLIFLLPNFTIGGAGNSILNICKNIDYKNYEIFIISLGKNDYKSDFKKININVLELKYKKFIFSISEILFIISKLCKRPGKTILISNINYSNVLSCIFFKIIKNLKIILIERTPIQELNFYYSNFNYLKKKITKFLIFLFYKNADIRIGNSSQVSKDLELLCRSKVITITPYIKIIKARKITNKIKTITWIGRKSKEKNINDLILSLKYLDDLKFNLLIITNIKLDLNKYNLNNNIKKRIKILQFNAIKLNRIYKKTDILVSTSYYEGFPNVVAEAINYNCLIVSSNSFGGISELIKNNSYGLTYKVNDIKNLSQKIRLAINNYRFYKNKTIKAKKNLINLSKNNNHKYYELFKNL